MPFSPVLVFHIGAAIIGLFSGFAALLFRKGSRLHRMSGNIFFISMLCMATSATYLALVKSQMINAVVGALTFYMVATGWLTVKRKKRHAGLFDIGAMLAALAIGASALVFGWAAANGVTGLDKDGIPAAAYFVFGSIAMLAAGMDVRTWFRGGVSGAHRTSHSATSLAYVLCAAYYISLFFQWNAQQDVARSHTRNTAS